MPCVLTCRVLLGLSENVYMYCIQTRFKFTVPCPYVWIFRLISFCFFLLEIQLLLLIPHGVCWCLDLDWTSDWHLSRKCQKCSAGSPSYGCRNITKSSWNRPHLKSEIHVCVSTFLDAFSHLYKRVCPSVRPSVRRSVGRSVTNELNFREMGRIRTK